MSPLSKSLDKLQTSILPGLITSSKSIVDFGHPRICRADAENKNRPIFVAIFNKIPTYDEIKFGTHKNSSLPEVNELFRIQIDDKSFDGDPTGNRTREPGVLAVRR